MTNQVDVAVIGAGQAGLATSWHLKQAGVEHIVLEAGRVGETWRNRRWDSFCLVTPNWSVRLPGAEYAGPDPNGYLSRAELVAHFQAWAERFQAPVEETAPVSSLDLDGDTFLLTLPDRRLRARSVVVAAGGYQRPFRPANADQIPAGVTQLLADEYRNPGQVGEGTVLIVGSGQTGCQLAEELHAAGRRVLLACGKCVWAPRRMGGRDLVWWVVETGFWNRTPDMLPSPAARLSGNFQNTGRDGGHDLNYRVLRSNGIELLGRFVGADDRSVYFADDLSQSIAAGDNLARVFMKWVAALCEKRGESIPWEVPSPLEATSRTQLDLRREGVSTVIWTSGYRPDYDWVHIPVFDDMQFPVQTDGVSGVPGLYFMGVHFQRKAQSAVLYGVGEDAEIVARHIAEHRR